MATSPCTSSPLKNFSLKHWYSCLWEKYVSYPKVRCVKGIAGEFLNIQLVLLYFCYSYYYHLHSTVITEVAMVSSRNRNEKFWCVLSIHCLQIISVKQAMACVKQISKVLIRRFQYRDLWLFQGVLPWKVCTRKQEGNAFGFTDSL